MTYRPGRLKGHPEWLALVAAAGRANEFAAAAQRLLPAGANPQDLPAVKRAAYDAAHAEHRRAEAEYDVLLARMLDELTRQ